MTTSLNSAIVRIRTADGHVVGAGFLVGQRQVLTCAHVVTSALGLSPDPPNPPQANLHPDFPLLAPQPIITARVSHWQPAIDIAVLKLTTDPPTESKPVRLVTADDLWGHSFRALGFPAGYEQGVWTSGVLRGRIGGGWVQIEDVMEPGYWVQPGFSGTPVWDEQLNGVVGMTVAADTDRVTKAAFMIPARALIEAWPELAQHSLDAGSLEHLRMQLARLKQAQRKAADPSRFRPQIDALRERIAAWDGRVEWQRERIAEGLEAQRRQRVEEQARRRQEERLRVVGQPPLDVTDYFKDRERDLNKLYQLLAEPTTRLVSVIGHGGMGKTALACKVLQDLERHRWPHADEDLPADGIVYLSTRTAGISLERLFLDCAKLLGGERQERLTAVWTNPQIGAEEKVARLLEALSERRYVILLDNLEDLLDDQGQLTDDDLRLFFDQSLTTTQGVQLMITSRVALAFRREVMRFDRQVKLLKGLPVDDGVTLLQELDPNGDHGLRDAPEEQLAEAVELTHGVPRALEVLAGILANDPFASVDEVLETFYEQENVVQALIEENYKRLDRDAQRVIEALAVFKKPVPPLAVDYLLEPFAPGLDVPGIVRRLTRTNIVSVDRAAKTVTLHPIDQDYAYSQLPEEDETESDYTRQALERRAADYYVQLRTPKETWESIDDLEPQLNEFEHRVRAGDYDGAGGVLEMIDYDYLYRWGHYTRLVELREKLREPSTDPELRIANLARLGRAYRPLGEVNRAINLYKDALVIAKRINNREAECDLLGSLGNACFSLGQVEQAIKLYKSALTLARDILYREGEGRVLSYMGFLYRVQGYVEQSIKFTKKALDIYDEIGYHQKEGSRLGNLGSAYRDLGHIKQAVELYEKALDSAQGLDYRREKGVQHANLGDAYCAQGEIERAIEHYEEARAIARQIGYRAGEERYLSSLGHACHTIGKIKQAISYYEKALSISDEINDFRGKSYQLLGLGQTLLTAGSLAKARQYCAQALELEVPETSYRAALARGIVLLNQRDPTTWDAFVEAAARCRALLEKTTKLYKPRYTLATALVGRAVCDPRWAQESERAELLAPALTEYRRALEITSAPGIVQDALRDLELIRAAGIEGLEPVFELLESAREVPNA